jgi:hypothetical protein
LFHFHFQVSQSNLFALGEVIWIHRPCLSNNAEEPIFGCSIQVFSGEKRTARGAHDNQKGLLAPDGKAAFDYKVEYRMESPIKQSFKSGTAPLCYIEDLT